MTDTGWHLRAIAVTQSKQCHTRTAAHIYNKPAVHATNGPAADVSCYCLLCSQRATCADKDVFKPGMQQQRCPVGTEYDPSKANVSPPTRRRCCRVRAWLALHCVIAAHVRVYRLTLLSRHIDASSADAVI
jgi:hypothetical protein